MGGLGLIFKLSVLMKVINTYYYKIILLEVDLIYKGDIRVPLSDQPRWVMFINQYVHLTCSTWPFPKTNY